MVCPSGVVYFAVSWIFAFGTAKQKTLLCRVAGLLSLWVLISFMADYPVGMDILGRLFIYFGIPIMESKYVPEVLKTISEQGRVSFLHS